VQGDEEFIYLRYCEQTPTGWWYERSVPKPLRRPLGRRIFRRYLGPELNLAQWRYREVEEEVQRLLGLSTGALQLRKREVRLVARDCARELQHRGGELQLPDEGDLAELLVNGFRARGLVLESDCFAMAREAFFLQWRQPVDQRQRDGAPTTVAGWVVQRRQQGGSAARSELFWHRELRRLLEFSSVSLPAAVSEGAAWRWRNHLFATASTSTAQRRLGVIRAFYAQAYRQGMVAINPFASLEPLRLSARPEPDLAPDLLGKLDQGWRDDPIYLLVRLIGLRTLEAAGLRSIDWDLIDDEPVLWIRSWGQLGKGRPCRPGQERCLPLPALLHPLWKAARTGDGLVDHGEVQRFAKRWSAAFRRQSETNAKALRRHRQSYWQLLGADGNRLNRLLGTLSARHQADWQDPKDLKPWLEAAAAELDVAQP
jgi:hypothetical protein